MKLSLDSKRNPQEKNMQVSVPQIIVEEELRNATNPFKKRFYWMKLRCKLCNEIVLGKGIGTQQEWDKIRRHLKFRHGIEEDERIPIRLLSSHLRRKWIRLQMKSLTIQTKSSKVNR